MVEPGLEQDVFRRVGELHATTRIRDRTVVLSASLAHDRAGACAEGEGEPIVFARQRLGLLHDLLRFVVSSLLGKDEGRQAARR